MAKYKVGDKVWLACFGATKVQESCPACFGKKEVTLILGNKDRVILPCEYCRAGFGDSRGFIVEHKYGTEVKATIIAEIVTTHTIDGEESEYRCGNVRLGEEGIFDTQEAALARSAEIVKEREGEEVISATSLKDNKYKSFAWNAGYHLRQAERSRRDVERHERYAKLCKARARSKVKGEQNGR